LILNVCSGDVKIFDFGLAKEYDPLLQDANGFYLMTGDTGSPRYMAPEVALGKPYNETVDVYSFSILLWQILKLETPYEGFTMTMLTKKVIEGGARPKCDASWPQPMVDLMHRCWGVPANRPPMTEVVDVLRSEMGDFAYILDSNILDASRKSDNSLRNGGNRAERAFNRSLDSLRDLKGEKSGEKSGSEASA
jgi:serine/threonine protein kinase